MKNNTCILYGFTPIDSNVLKEYGAGPGIKPYLILPSFKERPVKHVSVPSLGPVVLASFLRNHSIPVETIDFYRRKTSLKPFEIIGISSTFLTLNEVKEFATYARKNTIDATIVLGGPISWSFSTAEIFQCAPEIDIIVLKEGELTFLTLINALSNGKDPSNVNGIAYKSGNDIVTTSPSERCNMNELPLPDWSMIDFKNRLKVLPVETTRGCLYNCAFCNETNYWDKPVRHKNITKILSELCTNIDNYGISTFRFVDSCFTAPEKRCYQICDTIYNQLISKGVKVRWSAYARLNNLSGHLLEKMKKAGCVALDVGWESGSMEVLKKMNKHYNPKQVIECIKTAKQMGIIIHCNTLIGFPGESQKTINETVETIELAQPNTYQCLSLYLSPNTYLWEHAKEFQIEGSRQTWKHSTMDSNEAIQSITNIRERLTDIPMFAGGEFFACYLTSLDFSYSEINSFFKAINNTMNKAANNEDNMIINKVDTAFKQYW